MNDPYVHSHWICLLHPPQEHPQSRSRSVLQCWNKQNKQMIDDLPSVNDGEDEDEEIEGLHHGNSLLLVWTWTWTVIFHLVRVDIVLIPSLAALF